MGDCTNCKYSGRMCQWPCDDCVKGDKWEEKPPTNADRIRAMSDEELAEWLDSISMDWYNEGYTKETSEPQMSAYPATASEWLDWLKQEVEE